MSSGAQESEPLDVTPAKWIFRALAADISPRQAVADLIDNSLDHWEQEGKLHPLEIRLDLDESHRRISLSDNAGGLSRPELPLLFRPGGTNRMGARRSRGIYGLGSKRAMFALGKEVEVQTHSRTDRGYRVVIPEEWFSGEGQSTDWNLTAELDDSIPVGTTRISISRVRTPLTSYSIDRIKRFIRRTYGDYIQDEQIRLVVNEEELEVYPDVEWAKSKYAPPIRINASLGVPERDTTVDVTISLGVMVAPGEQMEYGFDLICNGRKVLEYVTDLRLGFGQGYLGNPHQTVNRFRGIIRLSGDAQDIPWNSSKTDLDQTHPLYRLLFNLVVGLSKQYTSFLRANYRHTRQLFSVRATIDDIRSITLRPGRGLPNVVKPYKEKRTVKSIQYAVPIDELIEIAEYLGDKKMSAKKVGEKTFYFFLEQVVRNE